MVEWKIEIEDEMELRDPLTDLCLPPTTTICSLLSYVSLKTVAPSPQQIPPPAPGAAPQHALRMEWVLQAL